MDHALEGEKLPCFDIPRLLMSYESLGENCDLGFVQRAAGVEPYGLFRFAGCNIQDVTRLLRSRLEPLGREDDIRIEEVGPRQEYRLRSRSVSYELHTRTFATEIGKDLALASQRRRIGFLKAQLLRDLTAAKKLFVVRGKFVEKQAKEMATAIGEYGPNQLLWVQLANRKYESGTVVRVSDQVLRGFVSRFGTYTPEMSLPVEDWITVCANAYRLWRGCEPPGALVENLIYSPETSRAPRWSGDPSATTRNIVPPAVDGAVTMEHKLTGAGRVPVFRARVPISGGGKFVFSAWVWMPRAYHGAAVRVIMHGVPSTAFWNADMQSRERWQRIWVCADVPETAPALSCVLVAEGLPGDYVYSTGWCLERGSAPTGTGFSL